MKTEKVIVKDYDLHWPEQFEAIKKAISEALGDIALAVEHVGSTSVPGLAAKPIIDIDVVIDSSEELEQAVNCLEKAGYIHEGDLGIPGREAFRYEGKAYFQTHHLYVCPKDSRELHRHLVFRDYLRSHPEAAAEYGKVKREGAQKYPEDIDSYLEFKAACIAKLYRECGLE